MEVTEGIVIAIITGVVSLIGYLHKRLTTRLDVMDEHLIKQSHQLDGKLNREQVKEIIADKIAPVHITLQDIKKDLDEISKDVKELTKRPAK
jgi:tRNA(Ser,Leu) C12 N-acetylase TAN1